MSTRVGVAAAIATELLYGFSYVVIKQVTDAVDPITLLAWRFVVAFAALVVLAAVRAIRLEVSRATLGPLLVLAAFQPVLYFTAEVFGVVRTTASESGLIISAIPVAMLVVAALVVGSRPSRRQVVGIAVTLAGVAATVLAGGWAPGFDAVGYVLLLVAVVAYALYAAFAERFAHARDIDKTFVMVASGAVIFGGWALGQHAGSGTWATLAAPLARPEAAAGIAYLALGPTIAAFFLQNVAISALGSTRYSTFIGVATLAALASGAWVLGERLSPVQWAGGAAILLGVYLANRRTPSAPSADV